MTPAVPHAGLDDAQRLMHRRRSVRHYGAQPISTALLERLLACAVLAPSAHNRQPWRFTVVRSPECKARLARAMGQRLREDRLADGDDPSAVRTDAERSFARLTGAPVVLLVATSLEAMDTYPDARRRAAEAAMAMQSTAMAVQNLMLAATAAGIGSCWMCAPLFCPATVADALQLPPSWQPQGLVTLGMPAGEPRERGRLPLEQVVRWEEPA